MKTPATDRIVTVLKEKGPLFDDEISALLPEFSRNTIRRARRELVLAKRIEPLGTGRIVKYRVLAAGIVSGVVVPEQMQDQR